MKKGILLGMFIICLLPYSGFSSKNFIAESGIISLGRAVEIRYVKDHPADKNTIEVEGKTYSVFNSKKEAVEYVEFMTKKFDLVVVYVRTDIDRESEIVELN